jgi:DNA repair exonuclease SbcCD ATPase subunit
MEARTLLDIANKGGSTKDIMVAQVIGTLQAESPNAPPITPDLLKPIKSWIIKDSDLAQAREKLKRLPNLQTKTAVISSGIEKIQTLKADNAQMLVENKQIAAQFSQRLGQFKSDAEKDSLEIEKLKSQQDNLITELKQVFNQLKNSLKPDQPLDATAILATLKKMDPEIKQNKERISQLHEKLDFSLQQLDMLHSDVYNAIPSAERGAIIPPASLDKRAGMGG